MNNKEFNILKNHVANIASGWAGGYEIVPYFYEGTIAASIFLVYDANMLFFCHSLIPGYMGNPVNANAFITLYDENNVLALSVSSQNISYDTVAGQTLRAPLPNEIRNVYFSRLANGTYTTIRFNGYFVQVPP
jgi:hypothetical protein